jgi:hypothetical protein
MRQNGIRSLVLIGSNVLENTITPPEIKEGRNKEPWFNILYYPEVRNMISWFFVRLELCPSPCAILNMN